jgi:hypothetical protein
LIVRNMLLGALILAAGLCLPAMIPATAQTDDTEVVEGEVVAVREAVRTRNEGACEEIAVRTRQRQELRLRLGPAGEEGPCCRIGDRIRARVVAGPAEDGARRVRAMWNRRTGQTLSFRAEDGSLVTAGQRYRERLRDGGCDGTPRRERARERTHEPSTGAGAGRRNRGGGGARR